MSLLSTLNDDMKTAMKAKDKEALQVIRMLKASIQNEQIKAGHELNADEELTVLSREMKQRRDALSEFVQAGREDLVEKVKVEIAIVEKYLPKQLTEEELTQKMQEIITELGATSIKDIGAVMKKAKETIGAAANGKAINEVAKKILNNC